jgi:hypothetical protein
VPTCAWQSAYLRLHPRAALKRLENPCVYHIGRDELYEIDDRAEDFLTHCDGTRSIWHMEGRLVMNCEPWLPRAMMKFSLLWKARSSLEATRIT